MGQKEEIPLPEFGVGNTPFDNPEEAIRAEDYEVLLLDKKVWSLMRTRTFRVRFEKYLNSPPADSIQDQQYHKTVSQITQLLAPGRAKSQFEAKRNLDQALELLQSAAAYPDDSNLCQTLYEAIRSIQQRNEETKRLEKQIKQLEAEKNKAEWNLQMAARTNPLSIPSGDSPAARLAAENALLEKRMKLEQAQHRLEQITQTITNRKAEVQINEFMAKGQLQSLAVQYLVTRRYQHSILANRFYRALFTDGDNSLDAFKRNMRLPTHALDPAMPRVELGTQLGEGGEAGAMRGMLMNFGLQNLIGSATAAARAAAPMLQSLSQLDAVAQEMIRDVDEMVEVVRFHLEHKEVKSATERLAEAFLLGEFLPSVRLLELENKRLVLQYLRNSQQLLTALEAKDYARAEELLTELKTLASDFDATKPLSQVRLAKLSGNLQLERAKAAAAKGDETKTEESIAAAVTNWHTNPELEKTATNLFATSTDLAKALEELDQLLARRDLRAIFEQKGRFLAAAHSDPERASQLEKALQEFAKLEGVLTQAREFQRMGEEFAAWEILESASKVEGFPSEDAEYHRVRAELAPRVAEFASAIQRGGESERLGRGAQALGWYLKAQGVYPASRLAREGMVRVLREMFPDDPELKTSSSK